LTIEYYKHSSVVIKVARYIIKTFKSSQLISCKWEAKIQIKFISFEWAASFHAIRNITRHFARQSWTCWATV